MIIDIRHRLCGTQSDPAVAPTGQTLNGITSSGLGSTDVIDISSRKFHAGDGQDVYVNCSFPTAATCGTANATVDIFVLAQPVSTTNGALSGTFTFTAGSSVVTATAHGLSVGTRLTVASTTTLPSGLAASTSYYVRQVLTADTFTLSATPYGAVVAITSAGTGTHTATWYSEVIGAACKIPFQRIAAGSNLAICMNSATFGYQPHRYISLWIVPTHSLTGGSIVADLVWDQHNFPRNYPTSIVAGD